MTTAKTIRSELLHDLDYLIKVAGQIKNQMWIKPDYRVTPLATTLSETVDEIVRLGRMYDIPDEYRLEDAT